MIKIISIAVVVLIGAVLVFAATRPDSFSVRRAISIKAPPDRMVGKDFEAGLASLKAIAEK
jgi:hypothetical protein